MPSGFPVTITKAAKEQDHVSDVVVARQPTSRAALSLSIQSAGLEDQDVYKPLGIDPGQWSRIMKGSNNFDNNKLPQFLKLVNNDIYLRWISFRCGYKCEPMKSTLEQQLEELRTELAGKEKENEILRSVIKK